MHMKSIVSTEPRAPTDSRLSRWLPTLLCLLSTLPNLLLRLPQSFITEHAVEHTAKHGTMKVRIGLQLGG